MRLYGLLFNDRNSVRRRFASKLTACPGLRVHRRRRLCNGCRIANGWWGQNAGRLRVRMLQRMAYILRRNGYRPLPCFYRWPILTDTSSGGRLLGNRDPLSFFLDKRMLCCNLCYNRLSLPDWRFCAIIPGQRVHRRSRLYNGRRIANGWWGRNAHRLRMRTLRRMASVLGHNGYRSFPCFYSWPILADTSSSGRLLRNCDPLSFFLDRRMLRCNLCHNRLSDPD